MSMQDNCHVSVMHNIALLPMTVFELAQVNV